MRLVENLHLAVGAILGNKLRAFLTFLGMVIGVGAVIASLSIGRGGRAAIEEQIQSLGTNLLFVRPGATADGRVRGAQGSAATLTFEDAQALADPDRAPSVALVAPEIGTFAQVVASGQNVATRVVGVTPEYQFVRNFPVEWGEFITDQDVSARALVAVLGAATAEALFTDSDPVGQRLTINNRPFRVIGVLQKKGGTGQGLQDDLVLVPLTTVAFRLSAQRSPTGGLNVQTINVQAVGQRTMESAKLEIAEVLRERHRLTTGQDDFTITSQEDVIAARTDVADLLTVLLGSAAGASLLIGGIGIMNIMLVSVTERTREIGIRKAVGAKRRDIVAQFLSEAALLSFSGGGMGIGGGYGAAALIERFDILGQRLNTLVAPDIVVLALAVSVAIGLFFGLYPAVRAARLNPVEALRYE